MKLVVVQCITVDYNAIECISCWDAFLNSVVYFVAYPAHDTLSCYLAYILLLRDPSLPVCLSIQKVDASWNVMAHAQKPDFVFRRNGRVHLNRRGRQFSWLPAAEVCASTVVMLDTPCSEVVWRVLATHSIRQFLLHFPSRASPCAIIFQLDSTKTVQTDQFMISSMTQSSVSDMLAILYCFKPWPSSARCIKLLQQGYETWNSYFKSIKIHEIKPKKQNLKDQSGWRKRSALGWMTLNTLTNVSTFFVKST